MIGTEDGYWYAFTEKDGIVHYEFFQYGDVVESGFCNKQELDSRFDAVLKAAQQRH